jgi:esterase/lipase superfamily enzyme
MRRLASMALLALAAVAVAASCARGPVRTMPASPIVIQDERLDFSRLVPPAERTTEMSVLFATTREPASPDAPEHFTRRAGDAMRLGVARVQLGKPEWSFDDLVESDRESRPDTPRPARVVAVDDFGVFGAPGGAAEREFIAAIDRQLATSRTGSVVFFVPGYRATFNDVMILMGSWGHFLGQQSAMVAFSWPTGTRALDYFSDCPRARAFVSRIAWVIELIAERSQARRINVMAFSCGGTLLAEALVRLREWHPSEDAEALQRRYHIANAIFAAADIDLRTFARSQLPAISDTTRRIEVYMSNNDTALRVAAWFAGGSRLGRPRFDELTREDLETIATNERLVGVDVTGVEGPHQFTGGSRGHGYWVANPRVFSDVLLSVIYPFDPAWRGLVHPPGLGMWTFPDDYPRRVGDAVYGAAPELHRRDTPAQSENR